MARNIGFAEVLFRSFNPISTGRGGGEGQSAHSDFKCKYLNGYSYFSKLSRLFSRNTFSVWAEKMVKKYWVTKVTEYS